MELVKVHNLCVQNFETFPILTGFDIAILHINESRTI